MEEMGWLQLQKGWATGGLAALSRPRMLADSNVARCDICDCKIILPEYNTQRFFVHGLCERHSRAHACRTLSEAP